MYLKSKTVKGNFAATWEKTKRYLSRFAIELDVMADF